MPDDRAPRRELTRSKQDDHGPALFKPHYLSQLGLYSIKYKSLPRSMLCRMIEGYG